VLLGVCLSQGGVLAWDSEGALQAGVAMGPAPSQSWLHAVVLLLSSRSCHNHSWCHNHFTPTADAVPHVLLPLTVSRHHPHTRVTPQLTVGDPLGEGVGVAGGFSAIMVDLTERGQLPLELTQVRLSHGSGLRHNSGRTHLTSSHAVWLPWHPGANTPMCVV
jgi:hypothetical protein